MARININEDEDECNIADTLEDTVKPNNVSQQEMTTATNFNQKYIANFEDPEQPTNVTAEEPPVLSK